MKYFDCVCQYGKPIPKHLSLSTFSLVNKLASSLDFLARFGGGA
nr:MAG TPA: hypothetical protein [Caudoviricetes sp.]